MKVKIHLKYRNSPYSVAIDSIDTFIDERPLRLRILVGGPVPGYTL